MKNINKKFLSSNIKKIGALLGVVAVSLSSLENVISADKTAADKTAADKTASMEVIDTKTQKKIYSVYDINMGKQGKPRKPNAFGKTRKIPKNKKTSQGPTRKIMNKGLFEYIQNNYSGDGFESSEKKKNIPYKFIDIYSSAYAEKSDSLIKEGTHILDDYKNANPSADKYLVESGKLSLLVDESKLSKQDLIELLEFTGVKSISHGTSGVRYLSYDNSVDIYTIQQELKNHQGIDAVSLSLLKKGSCDLNYQNNGNTIYTDDKFLNQHLDTVQGFSKTFPLENMVKMYAIDDGIHYNPQTNEGHPGFEGQISIDSRNVNKRLTNPGPDSTSIDVNTIHGSQMAHLLDRTMGGFVPKSDDDKAIVYKCGNNSSISAYSVSLAIDQIVAQKLADPNPDRVYIIFTAHGAWNDIDDSNTATSKAVQTNAINNGIIIRNALDNQSSNIDEVVQDPGSQYYQQVLGPAMWNTETAITGGSWDFAEGGRMVVGAGSSYTLESDKYARNHAYVPRKYGENNYGYVSSTGVSLSTVRYALHAAHAKQFYGLQSQVSIDSLLAEHSQKGILQPYTTPNRYNPDGCVVSRLDMIKNGVFSAIPDISTNGSWVPVNYMQANNDESYKVYLNTNTPGYEQQESVDGINPSLLEPGTYTAEIIVEIPGKDTNGNPCVIDYPIQRNFNVLASILPNISPIPPHFDIENDIPTQTTNVPVDATAVTCTLDGNVLAVNRSSGQTTATADLGDTDLGVHTLVWTFTTPDGSNNSQVNFEVNEDLTINTILSPQNVTEPASVTATLTDPGYSYVTKKIKLEDQTWQTVTGNTANVIYNTFGNNEFDVNTKYTNIGTGNEIAWDTDILGITPRTPTLSTLSSSIVGNQITGNMTNREDGLTPVGQATSNGNTYPLNFSSNGYDFTPNVPGIYTVTINYEANGVSGQNQTTLVNVLPEEPSFSLSPRSIVYDQTDVTGNVSNVPNGASVSVTYDGNTITIDGDNNFTIVNPSVGVKDIQVTITQNGVSNSSTQTLSVMTKIDPNLQISADTVYLGDGVQINIANTGAFQSFVEHNYVENGGTDTLNLSGFQMIFGDGDVGNQNVEAISIDPEASGSDKFIGTDIKEYVVRPTPAVIDAPDLVHRNVVVSGNIEDYDPVNYSYQLFWQEGDGSWTDYSADIQTDGGFEIQEDEIGTHRIRVIKTRNDISTPSHKDVNVTRGVGADNIDNAGEKIKAYPNPISTQGILYFDGLPGGSFRVTIFDMQGNPVLEDVLIGEHGFVSLGNNDLKPGAYIVKIDYTKSENTYPYPGLSSKKIQTDITNNFKIICID